MEKNNNAEAPAAKKAKKMCKYLAKWEPEFPFIKKSFMGQTHAFCTLCNVNFSVTHGGKNDVLQHQDTTKHDKAKKAQQHAPSMSSFVVRTVTEADQVSKAELKMSMLIAKNNIPFSFSDDFNKSVSDMFPDSAIARKYSAGKTKTTQLVKGRPNVN